MGTMLLDIFLQLGKELGFPPPSVNIKRRTCLNHRLTGLGQPVLIPLHTNISHPQGSQSQKESVPRNV